jgi:peptide/nickel transport system substrate-binding protein
MLLITGSLMVFSLVLSSCETTEDIGGKVKEEDTGQTVSIGGEEEKKVEKEEEKAPSPDVPKYGGILRLPLTSDIIAWDDIVTSWYVAGSTYQLTNEPLWTGDWAKGNAGGYGAGVTDWVNAYDVWENHDGAAAESWSWNLDVENNEGTIVYQIRQGTRFALDSNSEASQLVGGREMTADDVVFSLQQVVNTETSFLYKAFPELRNAEVTKTGPWEVTAKVSADALVTAITHFGAYFRVVPHEVVEKYENMGDWQRSVGTGPFILKDYLHGSQAVLDRNPNYWRTDPVGPGQGNQLPYVDGVQLIIIPDLSTRQAGLRTGKIDVDTNYDYEQSATMRNTAPDLVEAEGVLGGPCIYVYMNTQRAPFDNVKVRRAVSMAVDLETIKQELNHGLGQILTWPAEKLPGYEDLYLGLDDPEMPDSVKELYVYNPEKAKQVLAEAGYPDGFKTSALIQASEADYFSIIKDMLAKVNIDLTLDVQDMGVGRAMYNQGDYDMCGWFGGRGPITVFYNMVTLTAGSSVGGSGSQVNDPVIQAASSKMRLMYIDDYKGAMAEFKNLMKHVLDQAYVVSRPIYPQTTFWWPWLKNYSGEQTVGYWHGPNHAIWVWLDKDLKKSMGY